MAETKTKKDAETDAAEGDAAEAKSAKAAKDAAPYGWDVVGEDGRRIHRGVAYAFAKDEAARIAEAAETGEKIEVVPSPEPPSAWAEPPSED